MNDLKELFVSLYAFLQSVVLKTRIVYDQDSRHGSRISNRGPIAHFVQQVAPQRASTIPVRSSVGDPLSFPLPPYFVVACELGPFRFRLTPRLRGFSSQKLRNQRFFFF